MSKQIGPDLVAYANSIVAGAYDATDRARILMHLIYEIEGEWGRLWRAEQKRQNQKEGADA